MAVCADIEGKWWWFRRLVLGVLLTLIPAIVTGETVTLPMTVDFTLLRSLIVLQAYPEPQERAGVVAMNQGCNEIWLADPELAEENGEVRFTTSLHVTWGTPLGESCFAPVRWSGKIVFYQQPKIENDWRLRLVTRNSVLLDQAGQEAAIPNLIWGLVKNHVHKYIDSIAVNLAPPVDNLKQLMQPQTGGVNYQQAERFLATLRPEQPQVQSYGLTINILADTDLSLARPAQEKPTVPPIEDPEMLARVMALWQTWDALLVRMIGQLSAQDLSVEDRQLLLTTLLSVRYEFSEVIGTPELTTHFVRRQFLEAWLALKPLFQRHLIVQPVDNILGYLCFFTAADALVVLDRIGPLLGIDISRDGFYRMARMLSKQPLDEGDSVDTRLRDILGFGPPLEVPETDIPPSDSVPVDQVSPIPQNIQPQTDLMPDEEFLDETGGGVLNHHFWEKLLQPAEAIGATTPQRDMVSGWTAELTPAEELLPRVQKILAGTARKLAKRLDGTVDRGGWGQSMIEATAWQESCFRQFIVKDKKITYLLSYNNTSVGVMQVNEKVWRGIYDLQELRWNIGYNVMAGSEILALYLNRYVANHKDFDRYHGEEGRRYLATWLYSLYNGGPGQLKKFQRRWAAGKLFKIELSFQEKFLQVAGGEWFSKVRCLSDS